MPAVMISLAAASTGISSSITSRRGTKKKKPVVGFGVHGMNTETCSSWVGSRAVMSEPGGVERNTSDHMPGAGNSTSPTVRNVEQVFAELDELAADEVGGKEPEQGQRHERDDEAEPGNLDRQVGLRPVRHRD